MNSKNIWKRSMTLSAVFILLLICLASMNVANRYYYFAFLAGILFLLKTSRKIHIEGVGFASLFVLALSWIAFSPESTDTIFGIVKPFAYLLCYAIGLSLLDDDLQATGSKPSYKLFYLLLAAIVVGSLAHYLLNWYLNASLPEVEGRDLFDFWTADELSATGQAALACIPLAVSIAVLFSDVSKWLKLCALIALVLIFGYNLMLAGRTLFVLLFAVLFVAFSHRWFAVKHGKIKMIVGVLSAACLLIVLYQTDTFGLKTLVEDSTIYERFFGKSAQMELTDDSRGENKVFYLVHFFDHCLGGIHFREETGYAHDILLDTYDEAGIFALLAVIVFLINSLVHLVRCVTNKQLPFTVRQLVACLYIVLYMQFMVEPILQGTPWMFAVFCMIDGFVCRLLRTHQQPTKYEERPYENCGN